MSDELPFTQEELDEMIEEDEIEETEQPRENSPPPTEEECEVDENVSIKINSNKKDKLPTKKEMFETKEPVEISKKTGKPKRKMTEKQKENLAAARKKGVLKRQELAKARAKERERELAEKTKHIRERKARKLKNEALLKAEVEEELIKEEKDIWNEDRITGLMNRTLDAYFEKRQKKKELREQIPAPPQGYYIPAQPPQPTRGQPQQMRQPAQPPKPKGTYNPYNKLWGLDPYE